MSTSVRARRDARGFSFVELLITIVIAGIIFAAMVPVFVNATQKNSSDSARLQAANVAQDKIEKIRQLSYGSIEAPNLYDPAFADAQFGPETTLTAGNGIRTIYTDYQVTAYPSANTGLASQYKVVAVTAYWNAPPAPVKRVVLQTIVYRQYAGPPINVFSTDPGIGDNGVLGGDDVGGGADLVSVTLSAHVDLSSGATPASLQFKVSAYGGQTIASQLVEATDLNQASDFYYDDDDGTFYWRWDCSTADNTVYDLQATAFSTDNFAGNTMHLFPRIQHTVLPAPPSNVIATAGNAKVSLSWGRSTASGLASYEVFRATSATGPWDATTLIETIGVVAPATEPATTYRDDTPPLLNDTKYYYAVRAVTSPPLPLSSVFAYSNAATPIDSGDTTSPLAPSSPVAATPASAAATVTLTWGAAIDPAPSSGINQYEIWRSPGGTNTWNQIATWTNLANLTYADSGAGWTTTWDYRIRAVDVALNQGAWSATVSATTVAQQFHELRISVQNGSGNDCNVWVLNAASGHYFDTSGADKGTPPPDGTYIAKNSSVTFSHLADGAYTVFAATGPSPGAKSYGATVQAPFGTLSGVSP